MAYVAITTDLHGYLFSIDHKGDLYRNHRAAPGGGPLLRPGLGRRIGTGWHEVVHLAATRVGGRVVIAGVTGEHRVLNTQTSVTQINEWDDAVIAIEAAPWPDLVTLCAGSDGAVYGMTSRGSLEVHTYASTLGPAGTLEPPVAAVIGDWSAERSRISLLSNGAHFFDITREGNLRYQPIPIDAGSIPDAGWVVLSSGWTAYQRVLAADERSLYALTSEGAVVVHRLATEQATARMLPSARVESIGKGIIGWATLPCAVEGYAKPQQGAPGDTIAFHTGARCNGTRVAREGEFTVAYVRLQFIAEEEKRGSYKVIERAPRSYRTVPRGIPECWLANGAEWPATFEFEIPPHTPSGIYAAQLTDEDGFRFFVPFIVRPTLSNARFAVIANTNTWNAYNSWGGEGKYVHAHPLPQTIPFERPHPGLTPDVPDDWPSTELFNQSNHLLRAELWVLSWLDTLGTDYAYDLYTDRDLHDGIPGIAETSARPPYAALILTVHPEYWTAEMYDFTKAYQERGGSILYFGGNGLYEQVIFQKHGLEIFPGVDWNTIPHDATNEDVRQQCLWRVRGRPERAILGVGFEECSGASVRGQAYELMVPPDASPALQGLTIPVGYPLGLWSVNVGFSADGWEVDTRGAGSPINAFGERALLGLGQQSAMSGEMLYFETGMGGVVFAGSSLDFGGSLAFDVHLQRIVRNVLDIALQRSAPVA